METVDARGQVGVLAVDGVRALASVRDVRPKVRRRSQDQNVSVRRPLRVMAFAQLTYRESRGCVDFARLYQLHQAKAYFVTRAKTNLMFQRRYAHEVDKSTGVRCDQTIVLETYYSLQGYPEPLRRIRYCDPTSGKRLVFLTNDFELPATTIAALYKSRWQIELFFKWINQHLGIKSFYGTNQNAVKAQVWIAVSVYLLVAIVKKRLGRELSLYTILQILSVSIFEKTPLVELFSHADYQTSQRPKS